MKAGGIGVEMMKCGEPDNVKRWSLTMFRHGPQGLVEDLDEAQFRFGRFSSELEFTRVATLPKAIVKCVKMSGLETEALESGLEIEISISKKIRDTDGWKDLDTEDGWNRMQMVAEGYEEYMGMGRRRWSFCLCESSDTMEIVQANPVTGKEMPQTIWVRVSKLKPGPLVWAMDNEILSCAENGGDATEQDTLDRWISIERGLKVECEDEVAEVRMPGQPLSEYEFNH